MPLQLGRNYQARDGELRLLDKSQSGAGANGTPYGYLVAFEQMDLNMGFRPRPAELTRLNREKVDSLAHRQMGSDEPLFEGFNVTFSMVMSSRETDGLLQMVGTGFAETEGNVATAWNVKGTPAAGLVSTAARARSGDGLYGGGIIDAKGSLVVLPPLADPKKVCLDIETGWAERDTSNFFGFRMQECYFNPGEQRVNESPDFVTVNMSALVYGKTTRITTFSRAIDVLRATVMPTGLTPLND
jgi:hypothetical protein